MCKLFLQVLWPFFNMLTLYCTTLLSWNQFLVKSLNLTFILIRQIYGKFRMCVRGFKFIWKGLNLNLLIMPVMKTMRRCSNFIAKFHFQIFTNFNSNQPFSKKVTSECYFIFLYCLWFNIVIWKCWKISDHMVWKKYIAKVNLNRNTYLQPIVI